MKLRFEDRAQEAPKHFLGDTTSDRGNAQRAELAVAFIDELASERFGLKRAVLHIAQHRVEVFDKVSFEHLDANFVDPGSAPVAFNGLEGRAQQSWGDSPSEGMNFNLAGDKESHELSYHVVLGPSWAAAVPVGMFLSRRAGFRKEVPAGHLVALAAWLTILVTGA